LAAAASKDVTREDFSSAVMRGILVGDICRIIVEPITVMLP